MNEPTRPVVLKAWSLFLSVTLLVTALDLWSKKAVFDLLEVETRMDPIPSLGGAERPHVVDQSRVTVIPGFFELEANYNYGAFSGWFSSHTEFLTIVSAVAAAAMAAIVFFTSRSARPPSLWFYVALGLICGGTLGNFYDRLQLAGVRDWIKWFFVWNGRERVWPNFNIADSGICVGVALIVLLEIASSIRERRAQRSEATTTP